MAPRGQPSKGHSPILERAAVLKELDEARSRFHDLLGQASRADLRRPSNGTRWTNRQLLFHMLFGYLIVRTLLPLVRFLGRRPPEWSRRFAATLNAGRRPFHLINFLGSWGGGHVLPTAAMIKLMDRTVRALQHNLSVETEHGLVLTMHFPTSWDPYFQDMMSVFDVYHYGTQHFDHHRNQLSL
jgi:DinB superfamily